MRHVIQDTVHLIKNAVKISVKVKGEQLYRGLETYSTTENRLSEGSKKAFKMKTNCLLQIIQLTSLPLLSALLDCITPWAAEVMDIGLASLSLQLQLHHLDSALCKCWCQVLNFQNQSVVKAQKILLSCSYRTVYKCLQPCKSKGETQGGRVRGRKARWAAGVLHSQLTQECPEI